MRRIWQAALAVLVMAGAAEAKPAKPLFAGNDVIHLSIKAPVAALAQGSPTSDRSVEGSLSVIGAAPETLAITLSARGITRRKHDVCAFPPLRIAFTTKPAAGSLFKGQKKLKLVTHCRPTAGFQQYLLLEYAAYRLYNVLTPASFNVRLATIDYVDANGRAITTRLGFLIEDSDDMAERSDLVAVKTQDKLPIAQLSASAAGRFAVFEALISNLDWSMVQAPPGDNCCHNAKLIGAKGATADLIPVPYDFDFSGLVDAPYAVPPDKVNIANVRVRRYRGFCVHNDQARAAAAEIVAQQVRLLAVFDDIPQLDDRTRSRAKDYLGDFFETLANAKDVDSKVLKTCV